ncbi:heterokaryon incompatibility protein-domain-containing protein [Xylariaceae sp. FL1019]|nr:heterokaryon incompatibility protein-domain-containing protein [Xylariaceae sp. FL1019]
METSITYSDTVVDEGIVVKARRQFSLEVSQHCSEAPYLVLKVPSEIREVVRVSFTTFSHDQGWASDLGAGSYTWFEALSTSPRSNSSGQFLSRATFSQHVAVGARRLLHRNVVANPNSQRLRTVWDVNVPDDERNVRAWLAGIKGGDSIQLIPRAMYTGWVNFVDEAEIEILGRPRMDDIKPLQKIGTESLNAYRDLRNDLEEIRVLHLYPMSQGDEVRCSLEYVSLQNETLPSFEAVSYCWGDQSRHEKVKLVTTEASGNESFDSDLTVTESLYYALKGLRDVNSIRMLWVDAICINQRDIDERNNQVSLMRQVYSRAKRVVIWLGEEYSQFTESFRMLHEILSIQTEDPERFKSQTRLEKPHGSDDFGTWKYAYVARIFDNPWFTRVWVVQEAYNAGSCLVKCGPHEMPWSMLLRVNKCLYKAKRKSPAMGHRLLPDIMSKLLDVNGEDGQLMVTRTIDLDKLEVIVAAVDLSCTDPRDKIFAILQLIMHDRVIIDDGIRVDYRKSVKDVFLSFTRYWIRQSRSLRILSTIHADLGRSWQRMTMGAADLPYLGHPTWSFWYTGNSSWAKTTLGFDAECKHRASGTTVIDQELIDASDDNELRLLGLRIGIITKIKPFGHRGMNEMEPKVTQETLDGFIHIFDPWAKDQSWKPNNSNQTVVLTDREIQNAARMHPGIHAQGRHIGPDDAMFTCLSDSLFLIENENKQNEIGLCPHTAQVGDVVVVLFGGNVPFILRPRGQTYYLVGEAYCQGYMDGKAIKDMNSGIFKKDVFTLV